jgi:Ca2+-binding EF-hand superfamily protein
MDTSAISQSMSLLSMFQPKAKDATGMAKSLMDKLDSNQDGSLSTDEISKAGDLAKKILGADSNGDKSVSLEELIADITKNDDRPPMMGNPKEMASKIMSELDTNEDGVLSADEIGKGGEKASRISAADKDGDGQVTLDELTSDISANENTQVKGHGGAGMAAKAIMKAFDSNSDGNLSSSEIDDSGDSASYIQAADANNDGKVTTEELMAFLSGEDTDTNQSGQGSSLMDLAVNKYDQVQEMFADDESSEISLAA